MSRPRQRRSGRSLAEVARRLHDRDVAILRLLADTRLSTTRQIEALIFTTGSPLTRARRTRHTLARLHNDGLVARLERRVGGVRAGSSSHIYRLSASGRRLLGLPTSGWREPSFTFVDHTLAVVDVHVTLAQLGHHGVIEELEVQHEPHSWRTFSGPHGQRSVLKPDLFVEYARGPYAHPWFVELDRSTEHRPAISIKCQQYLAYLASGVEQRRLDGVFPAVLWIVPDQQRVGTLQQLIAGLLPPATELFTVATTDGYLAALGGDLTNPLERR